MCVTRDSSLPPFVSEHSENVHTGYFEDGTHVGNIWFCDYARCPFSSDNGTPSRLGKRNDKRVARGSIPPSVNQPWMNGEYCRDSLLNLCVECDNHSAVSFQTLERGIVLLFELPEDLINCENSAAQRCGIHLRPDCRKHVGWIVAKHVENAARIDAIGHYSPWPTSSGLA